MNSVRYVGMDVHRDTISVAVLDESGRLMMQSVLATRAGAILDFIHGVRGALHVTFEEGTHSAWLYDVLVRRVEKLVVCDPRKNALLKSGSKSDAIDARKLAELLRAGMLSPVYHGETSALEVQQMARSYTQLTEDTTRVMARLKAVFRGQAVSCVGKKLYGKRHRDEYLAQLSGGLRRRAEHLYRELDALQPLRHEVRRELMAECRKHAAAQWLPSVPFLGPIRAALLIGRVQTPHRFRTKRQFWSYCQVRTLYCTCTVKCAVNEQIGSHAPQGHGFAFCGWCSCNLKIGGLPVEIEQPHPAALHAASFGYVELRQFLHLRQYAGN
jgi:transposase